MENRDAVETLKKYAKRNRFELTENSEEAIRQFRECKVIFLGDGNVGKTSLIERIVHDRFQPDSRPTDGVRMTYWNANNEEEGSAPYRFRILDFGGQEIMHAMHRCFLTRRTIYVVVCDSREDADIDTIAARWLEQVKSYAQGCPVILALNKADLNPNTTVNEVDLRRRNPYLQSVLHTSAQKKTDEVFGVAALKEEIWKAVPACMDLSEASESWLGIKRDLEKLEEEKTPYITMETYQKICKSHGVRDNQLQRHMLNYFSDLGVAYFYQGRNWDYALETGLVLNPAWLMNGMYRLILRIPNMGFVPHQTIWDTLGRNFSGDISEQVYSKEEATYILHVMRRFELSIPVSDGEDGTDGLEMIPMNMPKTPSERAFRFPWGNSLHLRWEASFLPSNLIHRLMIRKYQELEPSLGEEAVWRSGGRFRQADGCIALAEMNEQQLNVYVAAESAEQRVYMRSYMDSFRTEIRRVPKRG